MNRTAEKYSRYFTYIKPVTRLPFVRNYSSTIFTLLLVVIFIFFAIKPTIETILVLQKKIDNAKIVLDNVNKKADNLTRAKENYQKIPDNIKNKLDATLPDNIALKSVILTLEQTAKLHDATISALQIQPLKFESRQPDTPGTVSEIGFIFNIEGTYQNLSALLQDLKHSSRLVSIDHLSINKATEGPVLVMSMNGKAYYLK